MKKLGRRVPGVPKTLRGMVLESLKFWLMKYASQEVRSRRSPSADMTAH